MASIAIAESPILQFLNNAGQPNAGGTLLTQVGGVNYPTYQDPNGATPLPNPIPLNSRGEISNAAGISSQLFLSAGTAYTFTLFDAAGNQLWTANNVQAIAPVAVGNMNDEKGSGGTYGFAAGVDFTAGVTTQLTLSQSYGIAANLWVAFDGVEQGADTFSLSGKVLTFTAAIPIGTQKVYVKGGTTLSVGTPSAASVTDASVAMGTKLYQRLVDLVDVKDPAFGAKGDGTTNDTAAITAADAFARSINARLYFPPGTYMASQLTIYSGTNWMGDKGGTILKQIAGSNVDFLIGNNSAANWGQADPANFVDTWTLEKLVINGNWNNGIGGNTTGNGIAVFGSNALMRDVTITNVAGHGLRTEYPPSGRAWNTESAEGFFQNLRIDTVGQRGWWFNGPNDSMIDGVIIIDAGQATTNTWDAFYFDSIGIARCARLHGWNRQASKRHQYVLNLRPGAQSEFIDCQFEGGFSGNVGIFGQRNVFGDGCRFFAPWNGINIYMGLVATLNVIRGVIDGPSTGQPACAGITFGSVTGDFIADNDIDVKCIDQEVGNFVFNGTFDGGDNKIRATCFNATAASIVGTPNTVTDIDILIHNSGGTSRINNRKQFTSQSIAANNSVTWTYPYQFDANPNVKFTPRGPSGNITSGIWITALTASLVTIFNNNAVSMTLDIEADATN